MGKASNSTVPNDYSCPNANDPEVILTFSRCLVQWSSGRQLMLVTFSVRWRGATPTCNFMFAMSNIKKMAASSCDVAYLIAFFVLIREYDVADFKSSLFAWLIGSKPILRFHSSENASKGRRIGPLFKACCFSFAQFSMFRLNSCSHVPQGVEYCANRWLPAHTLSIIERLMEEGITDLREGNDDWSPIYMFDPRWQKPDCTLDYI